VIVYEVKRPLLPFLHRNREISMTLHGERRWPVLLTVELRKAQIGQ